MTNYLVKTVAAVVVLLSALSAGPPPRGPAQASGGGPSKPMSRPTSKPAVMPFVTITKTDGNIVKGKLADAEWNKVKIIVVKDEQLIPWYEIAKISNGLTRAKVLETFRKDHAGDLCPDCDGFHFKLCETCKGTGRTPESSKDCPTCKGEFLVDCPTTRCANGQITCPMTCLKLSEGKWIDKDGTKVCEYHIGGKSFSWDETHVGELVVFEAWEWVNKGRCPLCHGTTTVPDGACLGTGKVPCPEDVRRLKAATCKDCEYGDITCKTCKGSGLKAPSTQP
jgi:hypothetical protein